MIVIRDIEEIPKYCWYYDINGSKKWEECPLYKSCKHRTSNIEVKPSDCPLVEIVTCKDCEHRVKDMCTENEHFVDDNFYCMDGKRRE